MLGPRLRVAAAWIERDGRVLLARRRPGGPCGGLWEFPGGKCREGERLAECLVREMNEEMGLEVEAGELLAALEHDYGEFRVALHLLRAASSGEPCCLECAEWRWVRPAEAAELELAPADRRLLTMILDAWPG